jgi:hypothetical protein
VLLNHVGKEIGIRLTGMTHLCKILPDLFRYRNPLHCSHDHTVRMDNMKNMITLSMVDNLPVRAAALPAGDSVRMFLKSGCCRIFRSAS